MVLNGNLTLIDTGGKVLVSSGWLCGREPLVLGPKREVLWPAHARKKKKC